MGRLKNVSHQVANPPVFHTSVIGRSWLTPSTFELRLRRPSGFGFRAGQRIRIRMDNQERDYSMACGPDAKNLAFCIRHVLKGDVSASLATIPIGSEIGFEGPLGYFYFQPSPLGAVFIATGTGIAPFLSMAKDGVKDFTLFHGVRTPEELYYTEELRRSAACYVPCLSTRDATVPDAHIGRVTAVVRNHLPDGDHDFYLCGRREMIQDMILLIDEKFPASRVYSEIFF